MESVLPIRLPGHCLWGKAFTGLDYARREVHERKRGYFLRLSVMFHVSNYISLRNTKFCYW
jgi:hypothetical protein